MKDVSTLNRLKFLAASNGFKSYFAKFYQDRHSVGRQNFVPSYISPTKFVTSQASQESAKRGTTMGVSAF
jgi:hypothetical protein